MTPATSFGFDVIEFARDVLGHPLDAWQQWVVIHAGELLPDGRPRFRKVLLMVSRQQGKTELGVVLTLYWLFVERVRLVLGTSTKLQYAVESWEKALRLARSVPELAREIPRTGGVRRANGETALKLDDGQRYLVAASNSEGGRSLTVDRLWLDELRQHFDYSAWDAAVPATDAVPDAQVWCASNAGSDRSLVLNELRAAAIDFIDTGQGDRRLGIFEYSAPPGASPLHLPSLAMANPNLGRRNDPDALLGDASRAVAAGGEALTGFLTERMCQHVRDDVPPVIPAESWAHCGDAASRRSGPVALALDITPDRGRASISFAAARGDGRPMVQVVRNGEGAEWLVSHLAQLIAAKDVTCVVVDGIGPVSSLRSAIEDEMRGRVPLWVTSGAEMADACGNFYDAVVTEQLRHCAQPELDSAVAGASQRKVGDRWAWNRRSSSVDISPLVSSTLALAGLAKYPGRSQILF